MTKAGVFACRPSKQSCRHLARIRRAQRPSLPFAKNDGKHKHPAQGNGKGQAVYGVSGYHVGSVELLTRIAAHLVEQG